MTAKPVLSAIRSVSLPWALPIKETSIAQVPGDLWNGLAGSEVMASHGWLRAVEGAGVRGLRPNYLVVGEAGVPRGAAACYESQVRGTGMDASAFLFGRLSDLGSYIGLSFTPALTCAPFRGYSGHLLGPDRGVALSAVEALAEERGLMLFLPRVLDEDRHLRELLLERGYHRTVQEPVARLDVVWDSYEAYLGSLRQSTRSAARKETRRCGEAGIVIREIDDVAPFAGPLHALADAHHRRLNRVGLPFGPGYFPALKTALGSKAVLYGAFREDKLLGFVLMLRDGGIGHLTYIGLEDRKTSFAYFNLAYYRPIMDAISTGLRQLYFGTMMYEPKVRRGCHVVTTSAYGRGPSRVRHLALAPLFRAHREWFTRVKLAKSLAFARAPAPK